MADIRQDGYEILNLRCELDGVTKQMELMERFSWSGIEMQDNNTTSAGTQYTDNTTHINNYGTCSIACKVEPESKEWIGVTKDQYEGSRAGEKPNGQFELFDRKGDVTSTWTISRWHLETFQMPILDSKDNSQMVQEVTIRPEMVERA